MIRPILFNTEMVQAIQAGRKTVTRRLAKDLSRPPYETGDVLWVRETWNFLPCNTCQSESECCEIYPDPPDKMTTEDGETEGCFLYRVDNDDPLGWGNVKWRPSIHMPKQAARIFLRVKAVYADRLQESVNVSHRPIKEIEAEGIPIDEECQECVKTYGWPCCIDEESECGLLDDQREKFADLWDSTIPKDKLETAGWAADPMVWVIRFRVCEKPEGWPG